VGYPRNCRPPQYDSLYPTLAGTFCRRVNTTDFSTNDEWLYIPKSRQLVPQKLCNMSEIYCLHVGFQKLTGQIQKLKAALRSGIPAFLFKDSARLSRTSGSSPGIHVQSEFPSRGKLYPPQASVFRQRCGPSLHAIPTSCPYTSPGGRAGVKTRTADRYWLRIPW
jgi:hypothetical protein